MDVFVLDRHAAAVWRGNRGGGRKIDGARLGRGEADVDPQRRVQGRASEHPPARAAASFWGWAGKWLKEAFG
jgi:hypothetical protein